MVTSSTVLNTARKYLGTVGNGAGNHAHILSVYNNHKPLAQGYRVKATDNWCDTFVSFVGIESGAVGLIGTECGVERHTRIFKSKGIWIEDGRITPRVGDIIVYNWDDRTQPNDGFADHIGFVEKVSGRTITTIEGNKGNMVARRVISVGAGQIRGYARPKYSGSAPVSKPATKSLHDIALEVINGKWGTDPKRSQKLKTAGYNPTDVQKEVNGILSGKRKSAPRKPVASGWISQNGSFTVTTPGGIILRSSRPSTKSPKLSVLPRGSVVKYDAFCYNEGYVWIRQPRSNGYGYLPTGEAAGNKRKNYWGSFK